MKSKLEIYALCVCFASIVSLVISMGIGSYSLVVIGAPSITMNAYNYDQYQTNDSYWNKNKPRCKENCKSIERPEEETLKTERLNAFKIATNGESRRGFQSLLKCLFFVVFSIITLAIHWKIAKRCREV
jgi:hypothetical protein